MSRNLTGNLVVCQSGGPTAVINSSLAGVIKEALHHDEIKGVYGAINGIFGILNQSLIDLKREDPSIIEGLRSTPSAVLGSCRYKLKKGDIEKLLNIFWKCDIRYFFINGGNDSMDTAERIQKYALEKGYDLRVIGIPKTVDNDLPCTDHCPGYGSAGRWLAIATMDATKDTEGIYTADPIKIIETMGRNTGWLAATTALAKQDEEDGPHLIYFPEVPFLIEKFLEDVTGMHKTLGYAVIVVSEGIRGEDGKPLMESGIVTDRDSFGHRQLGGVGQYLANLIAEKLNIKARCDKPGTTQRSSMLCASDTDLSEAYLVGEMAVRYAVEGKSGYMVTLERVESSEYGIKTGLVELEKVANKVRKFPSEYIAEKHNFVTSEFVRYFKPLLGEDLPNYVKLKKYPVLESSFPVRTARP